jgi:hypothetical protein
METSEEKKCCEKKRCSCPCHKMGGLFAIAIGVIILLNAFDVLKASMVWTIVGVVVILAGLQSVFSGFCKCCDKS